MESVVDSIRKPGRPKGIPKTGGRKKGTPNKLTVNIKDAVLEAFDTLGGVTWLVTTARDNPNLMVQLLGKVIPTGVQVSGDPDSPVVTRTEVVLVSAPHPDA